MGRALQDREYRLYITSDPPGDNRAMLMATQEDGQVCWVADTDFPFGASPGEVSQWLARAVCRDLHALRGKVAQT